LKLFQLRYTFHGPKPTRAEVAQIRKRWLATGRSPKGVTIEPIVWAAGTMTAQQIRQAINAGNPRYGAVGLVKTYNRPDYTLCDYDTRQAPSLHLFFRFARMSGLKPLVVEYDRTKRGWHVLIRWNRILKPMEQVAIQAVLGSDFKREMYNLARVLSGKAGNPRWNLLFESKL